MIRSVYILLLLVIAISNKGIGQRSNNWCFGWHCGINFNMNPAQPFVSSIYGDNPFDQSIRPQTISDCKGNLLFYTGGGTSGSYIWNREHKPLPSSKNLAANNLNNIFVPAPDDDSLYYLFQASNDSFQLSYLLIDLRQDSGRGDVIKRVEFSDSDGYFGGFIKHANDTDYWILFKTSNYTIHAYLLTKNGVNKKPVSSPCKGGEAGTSGNSPYMRSSNNGRYIISPEIKFDFKYKYYIYEFDKSTGKVNNPRPLILKTDVKNWNFSFSPNDSILYGIRNISKDSFSINQIPVYSNQPFQNISEVIKYKAVFAIGSCQLGADNRIYVDAWKDTTGYSVYNMTKNLSYIPYPDQWGTACGFVFDGIHFNFDSVGVFSQKFPCNSFPVKRINNKFNVTGANSCGYDTVHFTADADSAFKNYNWYFGDGDSAVGKSVLHQYKNSGSYYVKLGCELGNCGYIQWVGDSVNIKFKPNISLSDSTYYTCGQYHVQTKLLYKYCDSINLHLGKYDSVLYTNNSDTVRTIIYNTILDTNGTYIYSAAAKNKDCYDSVGLQHKVNVDAKPLAYFSPNYLQSCGNSTITLTDSSGMDSLLQQRKWTIYCPNNIIKQYDTASTNKLKLILQDTGYYHTKLIYITKQGCMDSLTKTNVFRILPQPAVYIDSPLHNPLCFGDSFILTAKQKDINYPPLIKYKWNAGQVATSSIKLDTANSYYVSAWNAYGCGAQSNTVKISFLPQLFANIKTSKDSLYIISTRPIVNYTWYKDSILYNTTSSLLHPPSGRYYVHVVDGNWCVANSGSLFYTGLNHIEHIESNIHVYPNPVSDILYIEWPSVMVGDNANHRQVTMYDMLGRNVLQLVGENTNQKQLSIGHLSKGLYIISVGDERVKVVIE